MKNFWSKLWNLARASQKQIKNLFLLIVVSELVQLAGPYLLKMVIDAIANFRKEEMGRIILLIAAMFLTNQAVSLVNFLTDRKIFWILADVERYLPVNAQKKMVFLSLGYHEKENTGNKISKIQRGVDKVVNLLGNLFWDVGPTVIQIVFTAAILFWVNWRFGAIFLLFVPLFAVQTLRLNRQLYPLRKARYDKYEVSSGQMAQAIININTVKSFVQENREVKEFKKIREDIRRTSLFEFYKMLNYNLSRNFVIDLGRLSILALSIYLVWIGGITIGSLVFVITISEKALLSLYRVSRLYDRVMESSEAVERLFKLSEEESDIVNLPDGLKPEKIIGLIEFKKVDYIYKESKQKALDGVSFKIEPDCVTAIIGPSGGGKTTVARMIYRHYDPTHGEILLDQRSLKKYDLYAFRKAIAIVPQEVEIFNASVRDNIAYANPEATFEEIVEAAKTANAEEFIAKLSQGYETLVGERGIKLSGGQRQRIGIARAILANPRVLIFDEATSNLDSYSERLIQEAMAKIRRDKTVIIIAHRLSTIKKADKILVLENGRLVEEGNHQSLAKAGGGLYARLLKLQEMGDVV